MTITMRGFIAFSVVLHAGAIVALHDPLPDVGSTSPSLRVSLVRTEVAAPAGEAQKAAPSSPDERSTGGTPPPKQATARAAVGKRIISQKPVDRSREKPREITRANAESNVQVFAGIKTPSARQTDEAGKVLRRLFTANFNYPMLARRKGWQGEVRLGLRLEPDGRLTHIRIVRSSGHSILDKSAIKTARQVEKAPDAARWLDGEWFDMVLPVQYRLNGS